MSAPKTEAQVVATTQGLGETLKADTPDCADGGAERKAFFTLQARAALRGIVVVASRDDRGVPEWIASLHAMCRAFGTLDELSAWLDRVEGRPRQGKSS